MSSSRNCCCCTDVVVAAADANAWFATEAEEDAVPTVLLVLATLW